MTIDKPLSIVGEGRETTVINLYPQLHKTEPNVIGQYWSYFGDAIVVEADDFTLQSFSINTPEVGDKTGGILSITGNRTSIINNQLFIGASINGSDWNVANNIFLKGVDIHGSHGNVSENRILNNGLYVMGTYNRIVSNHIAAENNGIHIEGDSCIIDGNTVTGNSGINGGIYVSSDRTWITRNVVTSSNAGIKMGGSGNVICTNNVTINEVSIIIDLRITVSFWYFTILDSICIK